MKKTLLTIIFIMAIAFSANAWDLSWSAADGADGYNFFWKPLTDTEATKIDVGPALIYDFEPLNLVPGTRYEFWVTAYNNGGESGMSDVWRWTMPSPPVIVEIPEAPKQLIINF